MERIDLALLAGVRGMVKGLVLVPRDDEEIVDGESLKSLTAIPRYMTAFSGCSLPCTSAAIEKIQRALSKDEPLTIGAMKQLCREFDSRLIDELGAHLFLYVDPVDARFYQDEKPFGDAVYAAFESARVEITEAAKCIALNRSTASVFHSMRALEVLMRALARQLKISENTLFVESGQTIIDAINSKISRQKSALLTGKRKKRVGTNRKAADQIEFASSLSVRLESCKDAWRNRVSHSNKTYNKEQARRIFDTLGHLLDDAASGGLKDR